MVEWNLCNFCCDFFSGFKSIAPFSFERKICVKKNPNFACTKFSKDFIVIA